ncbi:MAG: DUF4129 domain-containing protein [Chloroflexota bacterium]|nr:DUF4129 domain-containing protein [Chloroflexota bacterium]
MRSRGWSWLNGSLVGLARVITRVSWLYPWIELVSYSPFQLNRPLIPLWLVGLILLVSWGLTLWAVNQGTELWRWQLFIAVLGLVLLLWLLWWRLYQPAFPMWDVGWMERLVRDLTSWRGMVRPLALILLGAYLWWRGIADGRSHPWHEIIFRTFRVGLFWLVALAVLSNYWPAARPPGLWTAAVTFVVSSLSAMALVDLDEVRRRGGAVARTLFTVNRYWLSTLLTTIGLITLLGLVLTYIAAPSRIEALLKALTPLVNFLADLLGFVLYYLLMAIAYPLFWILTPLIQALSRMFALQMPELEQKPQDRFSSQFEQMKRGGAQAPSWLGVTAKGVFLLLLVGGIGLLFALALRRYARQDEEGVEETRELIWSPELMRGEWRDLLRRLRRGGRRAEKARSPFLSLRGEKRSRLIIRRVYQRLLAWAGDHDLIRPPGATPREYAHILHGRHPALEWRTITEAYIQARYSVDHLPPGLADRVRADWRRLSRRLSDEERDDS